MVTTRIKPGGGKLRPARIMVNSKPAHGPLLDTKNIVLAPRKSVCYRPRSPREARAKSCPNRTAGPS